MSSSSQAPSRKSKGRRKVSMMKMENLSNLQVTFSKRRAGLFKKASELCTLSGAEAAIVVFSPAEKVYCFGHPSVQTVLDRFAAEGNGNVPIPTNNNPTNQLIMEAHRNSTIRELNLHLTHVDGILRGERRQTEEVQMIRKAGKMQQWFPGSFDKCNYEQLCVLKDSIMGFKKILETKLEKDMLGLHPNPVPEEINRGFPVGFGTDYNSHVPTFNAPFPLGSNDFSADHGAIGFSNNGLFGAPEETNYVAQASNINPMVISGNNNAIFAGDYARASGMSDSMFFGGGINTGSSSSTLLPPTDPMATNGSMSFGMPGGYNIGYDPRML